MVKNIFQEYKIHNADVLIRDDISVDELIDVIEGNNISLIYISIKATANMSNAYTSIIKSTLSH